MASRIEKSTYGRYEEELIMQAINMAPECTYDQSMSNLLNKVARVFECILSAESP